MIVNWAKEDAGVLVLPCIKEGQLYKQMFIIPGYNEVPDEDWKYARPAAMRHIAASLLVELKQETHELTRKQKAFNEEEDLLTFDTFPFNEVERIIKKEGLYDTLKAIKKKETGVANLSKKWIIDYLKDTPEDWDLILTHLKEDQEEVSVEENYTSLSLTEISPSKASKVIKETYNLHTLEKWKREIAQPDLRVLILNQIEDVNKPPKGNK